MKLIKSDTTGEYRVRIRTEHGHRTINIGVKSREEAIEIIRAARVPELERAARSIRLSNEVVQQLRFGKAIKSSEALSRWEEQLKLYGRSAKTTLNKLTTVRSWLSEKHLADTPAHLLRPNHIDTWINGESNNKVSTREFKLSCLRAFFAFCSSQQFILGDPTVDLHVRMEALRHGQKELKKDRAFTEEEFAKLMAHCAQKAAALEMSIVEVRSLITALSSQGGHTGALDAILAEKIEEQRKLSFWKLAACIGRYTGLRLGDVCRLEIASIEEPAGKLIVWTGKTEKRVSLPLPEELRAALRDWPRTDGTFLFPVEAALYADVRRRAVLSGAFGRLCAAAGIINHFHALRSMYAQHCRAAGIPTPHISARLGHSDSATTEIYLQ